MRIKTDECDKDIEWTQWQIKVLACELDDAIEHYIYLCDDFPELPALAEILPSKKSLLKEIGR